VIQEKGTVLPGWDREMPNNQELSVANGPWGPGGTGGLCTSGSPGGSGSPCLLGVSPSTAYWITQSLRQDYEALGLMVVCE